MYEHSCCSRVVKGVVLFNLHHLSHAPVQAVNKCT